MAKLRSPIVWIGGKGLMTAKLIKLLPPKSEYDIYVEPFGGGASLLFAKEPHGNEVYNDMDGVLVNFFRVLRDKEKFEEFYRLVCLTPYSKEEHLCCLETLNECKNDIERAYKFFIKVRQSFAGVGKSWGFNVKAISRNMSRSVSCYLSIIEMLPEIHARMMRVQVDQKDFRKVFETYDTERTLFYVDPPYVLGTRKGTKYYNCEMEDEDHMELVDILLRLKGKVMLSGYDHKIYKPLEESGWRRIDFKTASHAVGKTRYTKIQGKGSAMKKASRTEIVWLNY